MNNKTGIWNKITIKTLVTTGIVYYWIMVFLSANFLSSTLKRNNLLYSLLCVFKDPYLFFMMALCSFVALIAYFVSCFEISKIPKKSSLYEAIMYPTIQTGPIKIILKVDEEENVINLEDDIFNKI